MDQKVTEILIQPAPTTAEVPAKGLLSPKVTAPVKLNVDIMRSNLATFLDAMNEVLAGLPKLTEPFKLDEIDLVVEVSAEGSLQLVGGVKVGTSGGITLKLKR